MRKTLVALAAFALAWAMWARLPLGDFSAPDLSLDLHASLVLVQETWGVPLADANRLASKPRITPDDFLVAAFLSNRAGVAIDVIWSHRMLGASWYDVTVKMGVPMDTVIVQTAKDHGPPYGKAWGYWKKHPKAGDRSFFLDDYEFMRLVEVQTLCRATGKGADKVIEGIQGGDSFTRWASKVTREKREKEAEAGKGNGKDHRGPPGKSKGKNKGN